MSYSTFSLKRDGAILHVTLNNPPVNLLSFKMIGELFQLGGELVVDRETRVVILDSANPEFFIAHVDLVDVATAAADPSSGSKYPDINAVQALALSWQALPQVTIAKVAGRCRGGGLEFILGLTMRFATLDSQFCSPEASGGFLACGGGTTRIAMMAGPGRAMEFLLSGRDFNGEEMERYGLVNRALPVAELNAYVDRLSKVLAGRSAAVHAMHREVFKKVFEASGEWLFAGLAVENDGFREAAKATEMAEGFKAMLALKQTREVELDLPATIERVNRNLSRG
ncbi:MAG: enoyl-CoA hydratase/isomerase family protein [Steroidobacteraceae bacterium]